MSYYVSRVLVEPVITVSPSDMNVISPLSVTLSCEAEGKPTPVITWQFKGANISITGSKYSQNTRGHLTVSVQSIADKGTYKCIATNKHATASKSAVIRVQGMNRQTRNNNK